MAIKPFLFNTEMVRAILEDRKTVTRRAIKPQPDSDYEAVKGMYRDGKGKLCAVFHSSEDIKSVYPNCERGDILWVRETWQAKRGGGYLYKADTIGSFDLFITPDGRVVNYIPWRPSIHMPKEAARIFLRVTGLRVERLRDVTDHEAEKEGVLKVREHEYKGQKHLFYAPRAAFHEIWDSTVDPYYLGLFGWEANPWVWVIEFERCDRPGNWK